MRKYSNKKSVCLFCGDFMRHNFESGNAYCEGWYTCSCVDFKEIERIDQVICNLKHTYEKQVDELNDSRPKHKYEFVEELVEK